MRMITKVAVTAGVALAGGAVLLGAASGSSHYRMVDQVVHEGFAQWTDKELELHGKVVPHSIHLQVVQQQTTRSFVLAMNGETMRVFAKGPVPDTFKDESEIIATGYVVPASSEQATAEAMGIRADGEHPWVLEASTLSAKCASHYGDQPPTARAMYSGSGH
ncbi:MAG TPA: cytochrome c maturation protein CcmE [Kofleriaceae bacterium]|nr:cytochrome c maturation protein CcmE [Kofleriaceae bacterium]